MSINIKLLHGIKPLRYTGEDSVVYVIGSTTHNGVKYNAVVTIANDNAPFDYVKHPIVRVSIDTLPGEGEVWWLNHWISLERE